MNAVSRLVARWSLVAVAIIAASHTGAAQETRTPRGATARCRDGTYSFSRHHSGTCSHHGGVAMWLDAHDTTPASLTVGEAPEQVAPACGIHCGSERWLVKTLSDPDRERVRVQPLDATVEELVALERPSLLSRVPIQSR